jgi:hypothetical protein
VIGSVLSLRGPGDSTAVGERRVPGPRYGTPVLQVGLVAIWICICVAL